MHGCSKVTEADWIPTQFEIGDEVTFAARGGARMTGAIEKLNRKTATVRQGPQRWRVPYGLLEPPPGKAREGKRDRLLAVAAQARKLMDEHGLGNWTFGFGAARRTIGLCNEKEQVIQLARHHAANDPPGQVTDTILHEIAHALAGASAGHGPAWRDAAIRIGATPRASKASDPERDAAVRAGLNVGAPLRFRARNGEVLAGTVVKLNRKTVRVTRAGRNLLVPYGCIVPPDPAREIPAPSLHLGRTLPLQFDT